MPQLETGYQPLISEYENEADTPQESVMMIHVVPESNKSRWNHIEDLDSFFTRIYQYHQKFGFSCMMLKEVLELWQFVFVVLFTTFLVVGIDYQILFKERPGDLTKKIELVDTFKPVQDWHFHWIFIIFLLVASVFWILRLIKVIYHFFQFLEIKIFYKTALKIETDELNNMTWHEVQQRVMEVQKEQQMCIHKKELTELDIYHRILRFKNYYVAMINKSLLPIKFNVPVIGETIFMTKGLKYNLDLLLFWGPWALFENNWHLKEEYKKSGRRKELAASLSKRILWIGVANFVLSPFILLWQILYSFFTYAELIKREPGNLGMRKWSMYGHLYLRHFNELDHELDARMCRAYKPAKKYMNTFVSHIMVVIAKFVTFVAGSIFGVLIVLTLYDEDVVTIGHVLLIATVCGMVLAVCRPFIPDEHLVWCPERLMMAVLAQIHYIPDHWKGRAHTSKVRDEFAQLFQYKVVYLLEELLSPIITPLIFIFVLRYKALEIVDFFRNFTVEVMGAGDVCSFAQLDVRRHGNPQWATKNQSEATQYAQGEDGKTELSLMHFTLTNPNWKPPKKASAFIDSLRQQVVKDRTSLSVVHEANPLYYSIQTMSTLGGCYQNLANSVLHPLGTVPSANFMQRKFESMEEGETNDAGIIHRADANRHYHYRGNGMIHAEGPQSVIGEASSATSPVSIFSSIVEERPDWNSGGTLNQAVECYRSAEDGFMIGSDSASVNMSLNALYLHEMKQKNVDAKSLWQLGGTSEPSTSQTMFTSNNGNETDLLLANKSNDAESS